MRIYGGYGEEIVMATANWTVFFRNVKWEHLIPKFLEMIHLAIYMKNFTVNTIVGKILLC